MRFDKTLTPSETCKEYRKILPVQNLDFVSLMLHRGTMGTEEQSAHRNNGHIGTVRKEGQRISLHRTTMGTEELCAKRDGGKMGIEEQ